MNRNLYLLLILIVCTSITRTLHAQRAALPWQIMVGVNASASDKQAIFSLDESENNTAHEARIGYGAGGHVSVMRSLNPVIGIGVRATLRAHRYTIQNYSAPTLGTINGEVVPGRIRSDKTSTTLPGELDLFTRIKLRRQSNSYNATGWAPFLELSGGLRHIFRKHVAYEDSEIQNANNTESFTDIRNTSLLSMGVGMLSQNGWLISLAIRQTSEKIEPEHHSLMLRVSMVLGNSRNRVTCPTF